MERECGEREPVGVLSLSVVFFVFSGVSSVSLSSWGWAAVFPTCNGADGLPCSGVPVEVSPRGCGGGLRGGSRGVRRVVVVVVLAERLDRGVRVLVRTMDGRLVVLVLLLLSRRSLGASSGLSSDCGGGGGAVLSFASVVGVRGASSLGGRPDGGGTAAAVERGGAADEVDVTAAPPPPPPCIFFWVCESGFPNCERTTSFHTCCRIFPSRDCGSS